MTTLTLSLTHGFSDFAHAVLDVFSTFPQALAANADFQELNSLTDAQLAERGLTRADLPGLIFSRHFD